MNRGKGTMPAAARTLTRHADPTRARGEPIMEAKFREQASQLRAEASGRL